MQQNFAPFSGLYYREVIISEIRSMEGGEIREFSVRDPDNTRRAIWGAFRRRGMVPPQMALCGNFTLVVVANQQKGTE